MLRILFVLALLSSDSLVASKGSEFDIAAQLKKEPSRSALKKQGNLGLKSPLTTPKEIKLKKMIESSERVIKSQKRSHGKKRNRKKKTAHAFRILQYAREELKKQNKPLKSVHFPLDSGKKDEEVLLPLLLGYFPTQEAYDQFVMWTESTQTQNFFVKLKKGCNPERCPRTCKVHYPIPQLRVVSGYTPSKLGRGELKRNSVIFDMELAYALNTLARILGLTDEEFERYKYAERIPDRNTFHIMVKVVNSFLKDPKNSTDLGLDKEDSIFKNIAKTWSEECRYTKILARNPNDKSNRGQMEVNVKDYAEQLMAKLQLRHERALIEIPKIIASGLFEPVKDLLQKRMAEALFHDQKSEVGIDFRPDQMAAVRRFFIGIKEYLYMPLSEEELDFVRQFNPDLEVDDASEVSTDYESSEEEIDIDEEYKPLDPDAPWDEDDEEPLYH